MILLPLAPDRSALPRECGGNHSNAQQLTLHAVTPSDNSPYDQLFVYLRPALCCLVAALRDAIEICQPPLGAREPRRLAEPKQFIR
jgi:hypothetical protein